MLIIAGNFTGPLVYKTNDAPRYVTGFTTVVVTSFAAGLIMLVYRFVCVWENRKRDQSGTAEGFENAYQDDLTDKTVSTECFALLVRFQFSRAVLRYSLCARLTSSPEPPVQVHSVDEYVNLVSIAFSSVLQYDILQIACKANPIGLAVQSDSSI